MSQVCKIYPQYPIRMRKGESRSVIAAAFDVVNIVTTAAVAGGLTNPDIPVQPLDFGVNANAQVTFNNGVVVYVRSTVPAGATSLPVYNTSNGAIPSGSTCTLNSANYSATFAGFDTSDHSKATISDPRTTGDDLTVPITPPTNQKTLNALAAGTCTLNCSYNGNAAAGITVTIDDPAAPPVAAITEPNQAARVGQVVEFTFESSSGVDEISVDWGDGDETKGMLSAAHSYLAAGTYTVTLTVTNSSGATSTATRTVTVSAWPSVGVTYNATTVAGILSAYNSWDGATEAEIVVPAGTVAVGQLDLPAKSDPTAWITIRTDGTMPAISQRLVTTDLAQCFTLRGSYANETPLIIRKQAKNIRFIGLNADPFHNSDPDGHGLANYYLIQVGSLGFGDDQTVLSDNPQDIIFQHLLAEPPDDVTTVHGLLNDGYKVAVISSHIGNIKGFGGQDTQAAFGINGRGAHVYNNCFMEGSAENVIYGGAVTTIPDVVPKNLEFRRVYFPKRDSWRTWSPTGYPINEKNLFEIKSARRVYSEGCIYTNHWDADRSQVFAMVLKSSTTPSSGDFNPQSVAEDVRFDNCVVDTVFGLYTSSVDAYNIGGFGGLQPNHLTFRNVLVKNLTQQRASVNSPNSDPRGMQFNSAEYPAFEHCTIIDPDPPETPGRGMNFVNGNNFGVAVRDSVMSLSSYGITGGGTSPGLQALNYGTGGTSGGLTTKDADASFAVVGNVFVTYAGQLSKYPNSGGDVNAYVTDMAAVGFADAAGEDYSLAPSSAYKGSASDGTDPGVDFAVLNARTATTVSGASFDAGGATPGDTNGDGVVTYRYLWSRAPNDPVIE